MVNSLSTSLDGRTRHEDKTHQCSHSTASLCDFYGHSCSYLSHHCVFVYALFISSHTSSLVSGFCHRFYSLSWHSSQGFISHFLFQLLKFLSLACWDLVVLGRRSEYWGLWEEIPGPRSTTPSLFLFDGSGDIRVLPFLGPAHCCWQERFTSLRLSLEISA